MISNHFSLLAVAATLLISSSGLAQDDKLPLLLKRSPAKANAIGYVNIGSLNKLMSDAGFAQRVSENVEEYWFLSDLDLTKMEPRWEAGYATLQKSISAKDLAEQVGGYVDQVGGEDVVWSPQQTYLHPGKENRLGILRPADRSLLSGWLTPSITVNYSSYLDAKASQPESFLSMMLAIEVKDVFSPVPLAKRLQGFTSLKANKPESVAQVLASATGVSIIVGRRSLNECILTITCTKSPAGLTNIAPAVLAEMLDRSGMSAPEVLTWAAKVDGNELSLQGPITESTLSGLLSIFSLQSQASKSLGMSNDSGSQNRTQQEQIGYRSKYYFDEINAIVEQTRKHKSTSTGALAMWNDKRARQIDELGTLNVDPGMVKFGSDVAETLRGNALNITQGNIQAGKTKVSEGLSRTYSVGGYYGGGAYYAPNSSVDYQAATSAYARGNAYANFKEALNQIDQITAEVRRAMTDKYKIQF